MEHVHVRSPQAQPRGEEFIDFGSIEFTQHKTSENAEFFLATIDTPKENMVHYMMSHWGLKQPGTLIRAIGALNVKMADEIQSIVQGLVYAAGNSNGYIFTNGLNFGLASFIGDTIKRERHHCEAPLIGVVSWAAVQSREQLVSDEDIVRGQVPMLGKKHKYQDAEPAPDMSSVSLQPVHTHFVIVKADDKVAAEGGTPEEKMLAARVRSFTFAHDLEQILAQKVGATRDELPPRLLVVINGDGTTLTEVVRYTKAGHGMVVLLSKTGGLAEALTTFMTTGMVPAGWTNRADDFNMLRDLNTAASKKTNAGDEEDVQWTFMRSSDSTTKDDVCDDILDCAMMMSNQIETRIKWAVEWNDDDKLKKLLASIPPWVDSRVTVLRDALQLSLQLEHTKCVEVCIENAAPVKKIDLLLLYDKLFDETSPPLIYMFKGEPKPTDRLRNFRAGGPPEEGLTVDLSDPVFEFYPVEVWKLLEKVVPGLCSYWRKKVAHLTTRSEGSGDYARLDDSKPPPETGPRWLDIYVWAVLLGKTELALSLLPACREPMRAAVVGARLCNEMATVLPLHTVMLIEASSKHQQWAQGLLDLCDTFEEAWRMLITKSAVWTKPLLHMAVQSDLRPFCCHVHCQLIGDEWLHGNHNFEEPSVVLQGGSKTSLFRMVVHMLFPVELPFLSKMVAWHLPPDVPAEVEEELTRTPPKFWAYYQIPQVKLIVRCAMHFAYTLLVSYATLETPMTWFRELEAAEDSSVMANHGAHFTDHRVSAGHDGGGLESYTTDLVLWLWTISLVMDEFYKYAQLPTTFMADMWNLYDYLTFTIVQVSLLMRLLSIRSSVEMMCFAVVMVWCRLFKYLQMDYNLGVLVIILMRMTKDIAMWIVMSSIVLVSFTVAFVSITNPYVVEGSGHHPTTAPIWAMLGEYDLEEVKDWNPSIGQPMMWVYLVISQIVFINLLIAMMGFTFAEVKDMADQEWKFGRLRSIIEVSERFSAIPPPFNLPLTAYAFMKYFCCGGLDNEALDSKATLSEAKRKKAMVARKLKFALRRKEEAERDLVREGIEASLDQQSDLQETLNTLVKQVKELRLVKKAPLGSVKEDAHLLPPPQVLPPSTK